MTASELSCFDISVDDNMCVQAGIFAGDSTVDDLSIHECRIHDLNDAGVQMNKGNAILKNVISDHNGYQGAVSTWKGSFDIINCTIADNTDSGYSHHAANGGQVYFSNSMITENGNDGINISSGATCEFSHNDVWGNGAQDYDGDGNPGADADSISEDPEYVDAANGDYHISSSSAPGVNAGTATPLNSQSLPLVDHDGNNRTLNGIPDMGAYETLVPPHGTMFLSL